MSNLTIRIDDELKKKALKQAKILGIPLSLIIRNAIRDFIKCPGFIIGEPEKVEVDAGLQKKIDRISELLSYL